MKKYFLLTAIGLSQLSYADTFSTEVHNNKGEVIGQINFTDSNYGLLIQPNLHNLPQGIRGFHIHEHPDCGEHGMNAGGHLDPAKTNSHQGPYGQGHLGDLPSLSIDAEGKANTPLLAPRLKTSDIKGHAVMIHAGGDNYSDTPPLGGGGERIACGKIES